MLSRSFPAFAVSVPVARRYVTDLLEPEHLPAATSETVALLVSELATNAVRYAGGQFAVAVEYTAEDGRVWIGVTDAGPGLPVLRRPAVTAERGRGLQLVGSLADRWGVRRRRGTDEKTVWFELSARPAAPPPPGT
ncbi:ATP-binding protein [Modestobacter sp. I12A-02662]|uniref:ATP-binding protein n=1 Tax=Modestobacter sp. I12A-02662 TaxID=1730496 RepID=UPI0034DFA96E